MLTPSILSKQGVGVGLHRVLPDWGYYFLVLGWENTATEGILKLFALVVQLTTTIVPRVPWCNWVKCGPWYSEGFGLSIGWQLQEGHLVSWNWGVYDHLKAEWRGSEVIVILYSGPEPQIMVERVNTSQVTSLIFPYLYRPVPATANHFVCDKIHTIYLVCVAREIRLDFVRLQIPYLQRTILTRTNQHPPIRTPCQSIHRADMAPQCRDELACASLPHPHGPIPPC